MQRLTFFLVLSMSLNIYGNINGYIALSEPVGQFPVNFISRTLPASDHIAAFCGYSPSYPYLL